MSLLFSIGVHDRPNYTTASMKPTGFEPVSEPHLIVHSPSQPNTSLIPTINKASYSFTCKLVLRTWFYQRLSWEFGCFTCWWSRAFRRSNQQVLF